MTTRRVLGIGAAAGFSVPMAVLALLWFGVAGVLHTWHTDLMYVVWPSSLMLTVGWRSTLPGIVMTVLSVAHNCLFYMAIAYVLNRIVLAVSRLVRT